VAKSTKGKPSMIVLETVKGKGWSVTEGKSGIHHITINSDQLAIAEKEIGERIEHLRRKC
jgi:Transketolase